jgi:polar amino acid transport system substrate-binding protein
MIEKHQPTAEYPKEQQLRNRLLRGLAAFFALSLTALPAAADQTLDRIGEKGTVSIGIMLSGPPHGAIDPTSREPIGYNVDLAKELAKRLGAKPSLVEVTPPNRVQFLQQGKVDLLIANMQWTQERSEILDFVPTPYDESGGLPVARKDSQIHSWGDLKGKKVCLSQGSSYAKPLVEQYGAQVAGYPGMAESLLALRGGNCVAAVHDGAPLKLLVVDDPEWVNYEVAVQTQVGLSPSVIWLRKGEKDTREKLDAIVKELHRSGWLIAQATQARLPADGILKTLHDKALVGQL